MRIVAIFVLLLGHLAAWAHEGTTRHVLCAQHGELVDAPRLSRAVATGAWLIAVDAGGDDDHCALADGMPHDAAPAPAHHAAHVAVATDVAIAAPVSHVSHLDFRIAPKTSPPVC